MTSAEQRIELIHGVLERLENKQPLLIDDVQEIVALVDALRGEVSDRDQQIRLLSAMPCACGHPMGRHDHDPFGCRISTSCHPTPAPALPVCGSCWHADDHDTPRGCRKYVGMGDQCGCAVYRPVGPQGADELSSEAATTTPPTAS